LRAWRFPIFFEVKNSSTPGNKGLGLTLGLATSRHILQHVAGHPPSPRLPLSLKLQRTSQRTSQPQERREMKQKTTTARARQVVHNSHPPFSHAAPRIFVPFVRGAVFVNPKGHGGRNMNKPTIRLYRRSTGEDDTFPGNWSKRARARARVRQPEKFWGTSTQPAAPGFTHLN